MVDVESFLNEAVYTILAMETNRTESEFNHIFYSDEFAETLSALRDKFWFLEIF